MRMTPRGRPASAAAVGEDRGADRASNDADVSSIPPLIPYGGFSPVRLEGWPVRRGLPGRQRLKPAPGIHLLTPGLPSPFVHLSVRAVAPYCAGPPTMMMHRPGGWVALRPRGPHSGPGYAVPVRPRLTGPIRPTRRHIATSPSDGLYAMPSLCGSAEATPAGFRAFAALPS